MKIKIITWNTLSSEFTPPNNECTYQSGDPIVDFWSDRIIGNVERLKEFDADVLALQECCDFDTWQKELSDTYVGFFQQRSGDNKNGVATFIRRDMMCHKSLKIDRSNELMPFLYIEFNAWENSDQKVAIMNCHLKAGSDFDSAEKRIKQVEYILGVDALSASSSCRTFVCGDFNDEPDSIPIAKMQEKFVSANKYHKHTVFKKKIGSNYYKIRTIDYIFFSQNCGDNVSGTRLFDKCGKIIPNRECPSDHYPLMAIYNNY